MGVVFNPYTGRLDIVSGDEGDATASKLDWIFYVSTWDLSPVLNKELASGKVYNYTQGGVTRYRFVPSPYNASQDTFYENFDSGTDSLTAPIVSRGI